TAAAAISAFPVNGTPLSLPAVRTTRMTATSEKPGGPTSPIVGKLLRHGVSVSQNSILSPPTVVKVLFTKFNAEPVPLKSKSNSPPGVAVNPFPVRDTVELAGVSGGIQVEQKLQLTMSA